MATKKKTATRSTKKKARPSSSSRISRGVPSPPLAPSHPSPLPSGFWEDWGSWVIIILVALAAVVLVIRQNHPNTLPNKIAAGVDLQPTPVPATAVPQPTPEKRSSSPYGPSVWNRKKSAGPLSFAVLRAKDGVAELSVFKAGNILVRDIESKTGPHRTIKLSWDGKDTAGMTVKPGLYYVRLSGAKGDRVEEILIK